MIGAIASGVTPAPARSTRGTDTGEDARFASLLSSLVEGEGETTDIAATEALATTTPAGSVAAHDLAGDAAREVVSPASELAPSADDTVTLPPGADPPGGVAPMPLTGSAHLLDGGLMAAGTVSAVASGTAIDAAVNVASASAGGVGGTPPGAGARSPSAGPTTPALGANAASRVNVAPPVATAAPASTSPATELSGGAVPTALSATSATANSAAGRNAGANTAGADSAPAPETTAMRFVGDISAMSVATAAVAAPAVPVPSLAPTLAVAPATASAPAPAAIPVTALAGPILAIRASGVGEHVVSVAITPANLGPVTVRAIVTAEGTRIELIAPSDAARDAVRGVLTDIRRELGDAAGSWRIEVLTGGASSAERGGDSRAFGGATADRNDAALTDDAALSDDPGRSTADDAGRNPATADTDASSAHPAGARHSRSLDVTA